MSFGIYKLKAPGTAKALFGDWQETVIWSALAGVMGSVYANGTMTAACVVLGDLAFIQIADGQAKEIGQHRENEMRHKAESDDQKPLLQICHRKFHAEQRADDQHRLSELNDQLGEVFGGNLVDDTGLA